MAAVDGRPLAAVATAVAAPAMAAAAGSLDVAAGAAVGAAAVPVGVVVGAVAGAAGFGASCFWHPANRDRATIPRATIMTDIFFTVFTPSFLVM